MIELFMHVFYRHIFEISVLIIIAGVVLSIFRLKLPGLVYCLWLVVLMKMLTPPLWGAPTSLFNYFSSDFLHEQNLAASGLISRNEKIETNVEPELSYTGNQTAEVNNGPSSVAVSLSQDSLASMESPTRQSINSTTEGMDIDFIIFLIWISGAVLFAVYIYRLNYFKYIQIKHSQIPIDNFSNDLFRNVCTQENITRRPELIITSIDLGPASFGLLNKKLIMPRSLMTRENKELAIIAIHHELSHLKRQDTVIKTLQLISQIVLWCNPLVWWANKQISLQREICCDLGVLNSTRIDPQVYASSLIEVSRISNGVKPQMIAVAMGDMAGMKMRLRNALESHRSINDNKFAHLVLSLAFAVSVIPTSTSQGLDVINVTSVTHNDFKLHNRASLNEPNADRKNPNFVDGIDMSRFPIFLLKDDYRKFLRPQSSQSPQEIIRRAFRESNFDKGEIPTYIAYQPIRYLAEEIPSGMEVERTPVGDILHFQLTDSKVQCASPNESFSQAVGADDHLVFLLKGAYDYITESLSYPIFNNFAYDHYGQEYVLFRPIRYNPCEVPQGYKIHSTPVGDKIVRQEFKYLSPPTNLEPVSASARPGYLSFSAISPNHGRPLKLERYEIPINQDFDVNKGLESWAGMETILTKNGERLRAITLSD